MPDMTEPYAHIEMVIENLKSDIEAARVEILKNHATHYTLENACRNLSRALENQKQADRE